MDKQIDLNFLHTNSNLDYTRSENAQIEKMITRYYRKNNPENNRFNPIMLFPKTKMYARLKNKGEVTFVDVPENVMAFNKRSLAMRKEIVDALNNLNIPERHIGADDFSSLLSVPGIRGKHVLPILPNGEIINPTGTTPDPDLLKRWAFEMTEHVNRLLNEPYFTSLHNKIGSYGGNSLNAGSTEEKLQRIYDFLVNKVKPTRLILALISRLQNDSSSKVGKRLGVNEAGEVVNVDNSFGAILEDMWDDWMEEFPEEWKSLFHGQRHRTAFGACSYMTMLENFTILPLMNGAYKKAEFLLKHRTRESVIDKLNSCKHWVKVDMGNWDQTIPKEIIHAFLDAVRTHVPECHHWRYDAYKEGFVINWIDYDGNLKTALSDSDFNASGWAFVSPLARLAMISFKSLCMKEVDPSFSYEQFYKGEGHLKGLCEGDDSLLGSNNKESLDILCSVAKDFAEKLGLKLEFENQVTFRGDNYDVTEAGMWSGYARLSSFFEKILSPEYSMQVKLDFAPIGHEARLEHIQSNPSFHIAWPAVKEVLKKYLNGTDLDDLWHARKSKVPREVLSWNAATLALIEDPAIVYKGKGIEWDDIDPKYLRRQYLSFNEDIVETMFYKGDFDALAKYLLQYASDAEIMITDTSHMASDNFVDAEQEVENVEVVEDLIEDDDTIATEIYYYEV